MPQWNKDAYLDAHTQLLSAPITTVNHSLDQDAVRNLWEEDSQVKNKTKSFSYDAISFQLSSSLLLLSRAFSLTKIFWKAPCSRKGTRGWKSGEINLKGSPRTKEMKRVSAFHLRTCPGPRQKRTDANLSKSYQILTLEPRKLRGVEPRRALPARQARKAPAETCGRNRRLCPPRHHHLWLLRGGNAATTTTHWHSLHPPGANFSSFFFNKRKRKENEVTRGGSLKPREAPEQRTGRNALSPPACQSEPACLHPAASEADTRQ